MPAVQEPQQQLTLPDVDPSPIPLDVGGCTYPVGDGCYSYSAVLLNERGEPVATHHGEYNEHLTQEQAEARVRLIREEALSSKTRRKVWFGI